MPPAYEVLLLNTAVPQIQAAQAGDTYVCPRDIQITANLDVTGNTILGDASTDTVQVNGYMGVGGAPTSTYVLRSRGDITNGTTAYGIGSTSTAQSGVTSNAIGLFSAVSTAAASFTVGSVRQLQAGEGTKGAGSTITEQYGLYVSDQTLGASNFGIYSGVSSGTNKWNIYASGTAANYFAGNVGIGTTSPQTQLELSSNNGAGTALNILRFNDADTTSAPDQPTGKIEFYINDATAGGTGVASYIMGHAVNTAGGGYLTFATSPNGATGAIERLRIEFNGGLITKPAANGHAVFNEDGVDADFRVESNTNTHALFVQGSDGFVGIGTSNPNSELEVSSTDSATAIRVTSGAASTTTGTSTLRLQAFNSASGVIGSAEISNTAPAGGQSILTFATSPSGNTPTERARIKSTGQFRFIPLAADPAGAEAGDVYYNSGTNKLRLYDGTSWVDLN